MLNCFLSGPLIIELQVVLMVNSQIYTLDMHDHDDLSPEAEWQIVSMRAIRIFTIITLVSVTRWRW